MIFRSAGLDIVCEHELGWHAQSLFICESIRQMLHALVNEVSHSRNLHWLSACFFSTLKPPSLRSCANPVGYKAAARRFL
jgi:hypothetical protein